MAGRIPLSERFKHIKPIKVDSTESDTEISDVELFPSLIETRFKYSNPSPIMFKYNTESFSLASHESSDDEDSDSELEMDPAWVDHFRKVLEKCRKRKSGDSEGKHLSIFDHIPHPQANLPLQTLKSSLMQYELSHGILSKEIDQVETEDFERNETGFDVDTDLENENVDTDEIKIVENESNEIIKNMEINEFKSNVIEDKTVDINKEMLKEAKSLPTLSEKLEKGKFEDTNQDLISSKIKEANNKEKEVSAKGKIIVEEDFVTDPTEQQSYDNYERDQRKVSFDSKENINEHLQTGTLVRQTGTLVRHTGTLVQTEKVSSTTDKNRSLFQSNINDNNMTENQNKDSNLSETNNIESSNYTEKCSKDKSDHDLESKSAFDATASDCEINSSKNNKTINQVSKTPSKTVKNQTQQSSKNKTDGAHQPEQCKVSELVGVKENPERKAKAAHTLKPKDSKVVKKFDIKPASSFPLDELLPPAQKKNETRDTTCISGSINKLTSRTLNEEKLDDNIEKNSDPHVLSSVENNVFHGTVYNSPQQVSPCLRPPQGFIYGDTIPLLQDINSHQNNVLSFVQNENNYYTNINNEIPYDSSMANIILALQSGNLEVMTLFQTALQEQIGSNLEALASKARQDSFSFARNDSMSKLAGFYSERSESHNDQPNETGDNESSEKSDELFNLFVKQCSALVKTEDDKNKLRSLVKLLQQEGGLQLCHTGFTPPNSEEEENEMTSETDHLSKGESEMFEGRTLLKGGVQPRHIPKTTSCKTEKDRPKDPRTIQVGAKVNALVKLPLPSFALELYGEKRVKKILHLDWDAQFSQQKSHDITPKVIDPRLDTKSKRIAVNSTDYEAKLKEIAGVAKKVLGQLQYSGHHFSETSELPSKKMKLDQATDTQKEKEDKASKLMQEQSRKSQSFEQSIKPGNNEIVPEMSNISVLITPAKENKHLQRAFPSQERKPVLQEIGLVSPSASSSLKKFDDKSVPSTSKLANLVTPSKPSKPSVGIVKPIQIQPLVKESNYNQNKSTVTDTQLIGMDLDSDLEDGEIEINIVLDSCKKRKANTPNKLDEKTKFLVEENIGKTKSYPHEVVKRSKHLNFRLSSVSSSEEGQIDSDTFYENSSTFNSNYEQKNERKHEKHKSRTKQRRHSEKSNSSRNEPYQLQINESSPSEAWNRDSSELKRVEHERSRSKRHRSNSRDRSKVKHLFESTGRSEKIGLRRQNARTEIRERSSSNESWAEGRERSSNRKQKTRGRERSASKEVQTKRRERSRSREAWSDNKERPLSRSSWTEDRERSSMRPSSGGSRNRSSSRDSRFSEKAPRSSYEDHRRKRHHTTKDNRSSHKNFEEEYSAINKRPHSLGGLERKRKKTNETNTNQIPCINYGNFSGNHSVTPQKSRHFSGRREVEIFRAGEAETESLLNIHIGGRLNDSEIEIIDISSSDDDDISKEFHEKFGKTTFGNENVIQKTELSYKSGLPATKKTKTPSLVEAADKPSEKRIKELEEDIKFLESLKAGVRVNTGVKAESGKEKAQNDLVLGSLSNKGDRKQPYKVCTSESSGKEVLSSSTVNTASKKSVLSYNDMLHLADLEQL